MQDDQIWADLQLTLHEIPWIFVREAECCPVCRRGEMVAAGLIWQGKGGAKAVKMVCDFCSWVSSEEVER